MFHDMFAQPNSDIDEFVTPLIRKALDDKVKRGTKKIDIEEGTLTDFIADSTSDEKLIRDEVSRLMDRITLKS